MKLYRCGDGRQFDTEAQAIAHANRVARRNGNIISVETTRIPDLQFVVVKHARPAFNRAGHATVFYRHDKDGRKYIDDVFTFYGNDGRKTFNDARRYGRDIVTRKIRRGLRNAYVNADLRAAVRAAGLDPNYVQ